VYGQQVKLCDPLVTRGPYLSALEIRSLYIKHYVKFICLLYFYFYIHDGHKTEIFISSICNTLFKQLTNPHCTSILAFSYNKNMLPLL